MSRKNNLAAPKRKKRTGRLPSASGYASVEETTDALLQNAITSVNNLGNYLMAVHDDERLYKANQALHKLWEIR